MMPREIHSFGFRNGKTPIHELSRRDFIEAAKAGEFNLYDKMIRDLIITIDERIEELICNSAKRLGMIDFDTFANWFFSPALIVDVPMSQQFFGWINKMIDMEMPYLQLHLTTPSKPMERTEERERKLREAWERTEIKIIDGGNHNVLEETEETSAVDAET